MKLSRKHLLFALLIFTNYSFSQETESKFYWGINASADYADRVLSENGDSGYNFLSGIISSRNKNEQGFLGYHVGGRFGYNVSTCFSFETGLEFSRKGFSTKKQDFVWSPPSQLYDPSLPNALSSNDNFYYLSIPLLSNLSFGKNKLKFIATMGVSCEFLVLRQSVATIYIKDAKQRSTTNYPSGFQRFNVAPQLGAGISYDLNEKTNLRIQPTFRYGLLKVIDAPITAHLWSAGINFGLNFSL